MNKARRAALEALASRFDNSVPRMEDIQSELEELRDEEQEYLDNMPESLLSGEKGEIAQAAIDQKEEALGNIESVIQTFCEIAEALRGAAQ